VSDLTPLHKMPLEYLDLGACLGVADLTPLRGAPLKRLYLIGCPKIRDLKPLANSPLVELDVSTCGEIRDLSPLPSTLEILRLADCASLSDLRPLANMKSLQSVSLRGSSRIHDIAPITQLPIKSLFLSGKQVSDLNVLRALPLESLQLSDCDGVNDLRPLAALTKLKDLRLANCSGVTDLAGLKGSRITHLFVNECPVADLSPLGTLPLEMLSLKASKTITDVSPLQEIKTLSSVELPPQVLRGLDSLRGLPRLTHINGIPAETYWRRRDQANTSSGRVRLVPAMQRLDPPSHSGGACRPSRLA
jgi:Leucine-rich repeat (LRR) protein